MRCLYCNGHPHDVGVHAGVCQKGHPLEIVGVYTAGQRRPVCRECQREHQRAYYWRYPERCRARWRAWRQRSRASVERVGSS